MRRVERAGLWLSTCSMYRLILRETYQVPGPGRVSTPVAPLLLLAMDLQYGENRPRINVVVHDGKPQVHLQCRVSLESPVCI